MRPMLGLIIITRFRFDFHYQYRSNLIPNFKESHCQEQYGGDFIIVKIPQQKQQIELSLGEFRKPYEKSINDLCVQYKVDSFKLLIAQLSLG